METPELRVERRGDDVEIEWRLPSDVTSPALQMLVLRHTPDGIAAEPRTVPLVVDRGTHGAGRSRPALAACRGRPPARGRFIPIVRPSLLEVPRHVEGAVRHDGGLRVTFRLQRRAERSFQQIAQRGCSGGDSDTAASCRVAARHPAGLEECHPSLADAGEGPDGVRNVEVPAERRQRRPGVGQITPGRRSSGPSPRPAARRGRRCRRRRRRRSRPGARVDRRACVGQDAAVDRDQAVAGRRVARLRGPAPTGALGPRAESRKSKSEPDIRVRMM